MERCIFSKFDILEYTVDDDVIKYMDKRICESEKRIFNLNAMDMHEQYIPYKHFNKWINVDDLWNSKTAYLNMMKIYNELVGE